MSIYHAAIIGAGPYGLATGAHLSAGNAHTIMFGQPMQFWQQQMPAGMMLRSSWEASHISDPYRSLTLDNYQAALNTRLDRPVPIQDFIRYGLWFQQQVASSYLDHRTVTRIEKTPDGFRLFLDSGEPVQARRVVVATGIARFAYRPPEFDGLPSELVSHSSEHRDLSRFAGKQVLVVGGGQSAFESTALLHECGAHVQLLMRSPTVRWLGIGSWVRRMPTAVRYIFYPPSDVGPPGLNWIVALPDLFRRLPRDLQEKVAYRSIRPAASSWLKPRTKSIQIETGQRIVSAAPKGDHIALRMHDGTVCQADHVLLATGYRVNIAHLDFLGPDLLGQVDRVNGYPRLGPGLESTVPGLYFVGAPAAYSYGPLMRFVAGSGYAASRVAEHILSHKPVFLPVAGDKVISP